NSLANWNTNATDYDVQAVWTHEAGHTMGIHHTEKNSGPRKRPTMYASYFGIEGRSLEQDDKDALKCSYARYPLSGGVMLAAATQPSLGRGGDSDLALSSRPRTGGALLRYALGRETNVTLEVFDVAGRV